MPLWHKGFALSRRTVEDRLLLNDPRPRVFVVPHHVLNRLVELLFHQMRLIAGDGAYFAKILVVLLNRRARWTCDVLHAVGI